MSFKNYFIVFLFVILPTVLISQEVVYQGKEFWFGVPDVQCPANEGYSGVSPFYLLISSNANGKINISSAYKSLSGDYNVERNKTLKIPINIDLMNNLPAEKNNKGIHVTSNVSITITFFVEYYNTSEAFRIMPVEYLGKNYISLNLYEDKTPDLKVPEILIIATEDNTSIQIKPKIVTVESDNLNPFSIDLSKGQTYLIESKKDSINPQDQSTDLSGTTIESNKPIAVLSGHTKGAFPRLPYLTPGGDDFIRNLLIEMLIPIERLDTNYMVIPIRYLNRNMGIYPDAKGDLIRFVAILDNTYIYKQRIDGSYAQISSKLKKGKYYDIYEAESPMVLKSNNPVIVGQYGKSWASHYNFYSILELIMNKIDITYGLGMMINVPPISFWSNNASFDSPEGVDNFVNISFRSADSLSINFDGAPIATYFKNKIHVINDSVYAYISEPVSAGRHFVNGTGNEKFAVYSYGNRDIASEIGLSKIKDNDKSHFMTHTKILSDSSKYPFAYGYNASFSYSALCRDSTSITFNVGECGKVTGKAIAINLNVNNDCAGVNSICLRDSSNNYVLNLPDFQAGSKEAAFELEVIDKSKPARAVLSAYSFDGRFSTIEINYIPDYLDFSQTTLEFGVSEPHQSNFKKIQLINNGKTPVNINNISSVGLHSDIQPTDSFPLIVLPGETKELNICINPQEFYPYFQERCLFAQLDCYNQQIDSIRFRTGDPLIWFNDAEWVDVPAHTSSSKTITIENRGTFKAWIESFDQNDWVHFNVDRNPFGLILPNEKMEFTVIYKPDKDGDTNRARAVITSTAEKEKLYSDWVGISKSITGVSDGMNKNEPLLSEFSISPNPAQNYTCINYRLSAPAIVKLTLFNQYASKIFETGNSLQAMGINKFELDFEKLGLSSGFYFYVLEAGNIRKSGEIIVIR